MIEEIDNYEIIFENVKIPINIFKKPQELNKTYEVGIIEISKYTQIVLDQIKKDIGREGIFEKSKEKSLGYEDLKNFFFKKANELIRYYFPKLSIETRDKILTYLIQKTLDLGFIDILLSDNKIEEITANGEKNNIMIYHRDYGWLETNLKFENATELESIINRIALDNKKNFSNLYPLLDAHLKAGHRVNATLGGISTKGSTITIRRFNDNPWTISQMLANKTSSPEVLALLWIAFENEFSVIITGGTGSGKTSYLNAISQFIPTDQRIISVEDTREIRLPDYTHWVPMEARQINQEGKGEVSILDLIINSLRMRPDRIIIGEIRRKAEAEVLFEAMRTGHSVYGTFHANTSNETILRLSSSPISIPKITLSAIGLIVVQHRDRRSGKRYTLQIAEVDELGNDRVIYHYNPKTKKYVLRNSPISILKKLEEFSGITKEEFNKDMAEKIIILKYLEKNNIKDIKIIGKLMGLYYTNKKKLYALINNSSRKNIK